MFFKNNSNQQYGNAPKIDQSHWKRGNDEFAVRVETEDLPGLLQRGLVVEPGTNAMLVERGSNRGVFPPGEYRMDSLPERIKSWVTGSGGRVTALLVDITPTEMVFHLGGIFTKDPLKIGLTVRMQADVQDPARFVINVLKGNERYGKEDLRQFLYPEVVQIAQKWVEKHTIQELMDDLTLKEKLALALEEGMLITLGQSGLRFLQVRTAEFNLETIDKIRGQKSSYSLQVAEGEAEIEGRQRLAGVSGQLNLLDLAEETGKVENEERKAQLYERMRNALKNDKMGEIRSEAEFKQFLAGMDREELLSERERGELLRTWKENDLDHEIARGHLLAKLDLENKYELRAIELKQRTDLTRAEVEVKLIEERARVEAYLAIEAQKQDFELKRKRAQRDFERLIENEGLDFDAKKRSMERDEDQKDALMGLETLHTMQINKLKIKQLEMEQKWADDERNLNMRLAEKRAEVEILLKMEAARHIQKIEEKKQDQEFILNKADRMGGMDELGKLALSDPEQARAIQAVIEARIKAGRSAEQIWAEVAGQSPEAARIFAQIQSDDRHRDQEDQKKATGDMLGQVKDQINMLLDQQKLQGERERDHTRVQQDMYEKGMQTAAQIARDVSQASAQHANSNPPLIITPGGGTAQVMPLSGSAAASQQFAAVLKTCTKCGKQVKEDVRFCPHCGTKFEGV